MKNGFTLVELLAVIVILAVLALIATPVVLSIIDDTKESAMLRSAEMYLSGVENAVIRENMNSGGNFRPNACTISNGTLSCNGTTVEVEVNGEVPKEGTIVFENGKIKEVELIYESGTIIKDDSGNLVYEESTNEKIVISPKKENYTVGEEVTIGEENFYVIADDTEKVTLLAKDCIDTTNLVQSANANDVAFSSSYYWEEATNPKELDLNDYPIPEGVTSVITTAKAYGEKIGGTGRLMTLEEAEELDIEPYWDIVYGTETYLFYWLSTNDSGGCVRSVDGFGGGLYFTAYDVPEGVRPVVEISKSNIY